MEERAMNAPETCFSAGGVTAEAAKRRASGF